MIPSDAATFTDAVSGRWLTLAEELRRRLGGGVTLDIATRGLFERRLGVDLGAARVHANPLAGELAEAADARAFTVGTHVFAAPLRLDLDTPADVGLLGHELTHVAQHAAPVQRTGELGARQVEEEYRSPPVRRRAASPSPAQVAEGVYRRLVDELQRFYGVGG